MPPRKRKTVDEQQVVVEESPKYVAGKVPRTQGRQPEVDYSQPLDPRSELFVDHWSVPKFNRFVTFTLDQLSETYKGVFKDFIKLPSRKFHPQYYYKIQQPISINEIKSRDYEYQDGPHNFLLDVELLAKNCLSYNESDSLIVKNAFQMINFVKYETLKAKNVKRNYMMHDEIKTRLIRYLERVINATEKIVNDELGRPKREGLDDEIKLSDPFMEFVDKDELPEYYEVIHRPSAISEVKKNLDLSYYPKIYDFIIDMHLVFQNALIFNDSTSLIYESALNLLEYFDHLILDEFFPELKDLSERGELKLEVDQFEYEKYLGSSTQPNQIVLPDDDEDDDAYNNIEGLGNGYTRSLLTEDYLLGPTTNNEPQLKKSRIYSIGADEERPEILKYNIVKSINKEPISEQFTMKFKPFNMIDEVTLFASKSLYNQAINPMPGSRPACTQNWLEFTFKANELNQNENIFSFSLEPVQTFLTLVANVKDPKLKSSLTLNRESVKPRDDVKPKVIKPENEDAKPDLEEVDNDPITKFDIRLNEGLNYLEYKCEMENAEESELLRFWINVLP
ncbi:hypothetical protein KAFR_0D03530 [Kazachstania africana CBS 2517]|uniref:Bromo domain-containing protein n=1 Tax=Kazachstania africana (strain ATCC 22294 / BCRC 22015 / CBS 2517 / CECT 1963 / NBRC 1671 / NRRL Y-8276) TaxID=1071382 RepID=H2AUF1_KAZAF|nr:hypothetical protein KAFR_0D03530 [Kazachstania africana CBS 2517]CCF58001.1 hypothetical protein KAFR_0D03530 [Kazachstania africana CBS 2517]